MTHAPADGHAEDDQSDDASSLAVPEALASFEARLLLAQEFGGAHTFEWNALTDTAIASPAFKALFGLSADRPLNAAAILSCVHPDDLRRVQDNQERVLRRGGPFEDEFRIRLPDGSIRWILARGRSVKNEAGEIVGLAGVNLDITDRKEIELELARREAELRTSEQKFRVIADTMPQMVWSTLPNGDHDYYNARWYEFTGVPVGSTDGEGWSGMFHPEDQQRAWRRWRRSLATGEPYEIEYRLRHHSGAWRWTLGRALPIRDEDGTITRWFGTCTDIHETKQLAEQMSLLSHELSHRIKNIFAIIDGLVSFSAKRFPEAATFAKDLRQRLVALGRAHEVARPHSEDMVSGADKTSLHALLGEILRPYPAMDEGRLTLRGDDLDIDERSVTPLALIFHELATNACKYGALSLPEGRVTIDSACKDGTWSIGWIEEGGPDVTSPPVRTGFGTSLSTLAIERHLGGAIERRWLREGLQVHMTCPAGRLRRS